VAAERFVPILVVNCMCDCALYHAMLNHLALDKKRSPDLKIRSQSLWKSLGAEKLKSICCLDTSLGVCVGGLAGQTTVSVMLRKPHTDIILTASASKPGLAPGFPLFFSLTNGC